MEQNMQQFAGVCYSKDHRSQMHTAEWTGSNQISNWNKVILLREFGKSDLEYS